MHDPAPPLPEPRRLSWPARLALAAPACFLYAALAPRVAGEGDSAEFTLALVLAGVPHPPGYPLWTLAGSAFVHALHAAGAGWAHAANLWSALTGAAAVLFTLALADELADAPLPRAARACALGGAALALAALPTFVRAATQAEVYAFGVAWTALAAYAAIRALRALERGAAPTARAALAAGALLGAALAHRPTLLATAVPLGLVLARALASRRLLAPRLVALAAAGAAAPLASWGWIAWRASHPAAYQWPQLEPGWRSLLEHASGAHYLAYFRGHADAGSALALFTGSLAPVLALGLAAAVSVLPRLRGAERAVFAAFGVTTLLLGTFVLAYGVRDFDFFLLPLGVFACAAIARAAGEWLARSREPLTPAALALTVLAFVAAIPVATEARRLAAIAAVDASVREAFEALPFERGVVLWDSDAHARLVALQLLEGRKRDVVVLNPSALTWPAARRAATARLDFDPLEGLELRSQEDLAGLGPHLAERRGIAVADFAAWWDARSAAR